MIIKKSFLFLLFFTLSILIYFGLEEFKKDKISQYQNEIFYLTNKQMIDKFDSIYFESFYKNFVNDSLTMFIDKKGIYAKSILEQAQTNINLNAHFDTISNELQNVNLKTIFLLNKVDSEKIDLEHSYTGVFLDNHYVINKNAGDYYIKILKQSGIVDKGIDKIINKEDGYTIVRKKIYSKNSKHIMDAYLIRSSDFIEFNQIENIRDFINIITTLSIVFLILLFYYIKNLTENTYYKKQNEVLLKDVSKLKTLSDKLELNEKKVANLFNLQPNIMFISNGNSIVQVNKRFMGFFRRYKTFENFKEQHSDISELFEPIDHPDYIVSRNIEDKFWLEYILENPKKIYKAIMSVDNEPHHFIIKVNEMEYVKRYNERYIVVALVDVTQDIVNQNN